MKMLTVRLCIYQVLHKGPTVEPLRHSFLYEIVNIELSKLIFHEFCKKKTLFVIARYNNFTALVKKEDLLCFVYGYTKVTRIHKGQ